MTTTAARAYLDHNATTPLDPAVREAVIAALDLGNPSAIHAEGRRARAAVEGARRDVGRFLSVAAEDIVFTSGATEALAMALQPVEAREHLIVGAVEHLAVLEGHGFPPERCERLPVDGVGRVRLDVLAARLDKIDGRPVLALQSANNETGVIQPLAEAADLVHSAGGRVVCDAVQSAGKTDLAVTLASADVVVISGHKLGGPKGTGAAGWRSGTRQVSPLLRGGGQERGLRAGTESVANIVGLGTAARLAPGRIASDVSSLRDRLESGLRDLASDIVVFGEGNDRLPNTSAVALPGLSAQVALIALDLAGVAASSGSACTSGKVRPSHVLEAMGIDPTLAACALRFSLGPRTTADEIDRTLEIFHDLLRRVRPSAVAA